MYWGSSLELVTGLRLESGQHRLEQNEIPVGASLPLVSP